MSERLVIPDRADAESELSVDQPWWQFSARFNVAASQRVPVVRLHGRESEGVMMRWGLVPAAAKGDVSRPGYACLSGDALQNSVDFRTAWLFGQRGIVPLAGFYVWRRTRAGHRQPYYVRLDNRSVFGVAVLWERSVTDDDDVVESCALLTVPANAFLAKIDTRSDQMPVILHRQDYATWLRANVSDAAALLTTYSASRMVSHPVAPYVNDLQFDEPRLIHPEAQDSAH
jgi:putative SOS response-associated peptidase YedK